MIQKSRLFLFFASALMLVLPMTVATTAQAQTQPKLSYQGDAYGSFVFVGNTVRVGKTAPAGIGCGTQPPKVATNTVAGVSLPPVIDLGGVDTEARALNFNNVSLSRSIANVSGINLVNGLISVDAIKSISATAVDANGKFSTGSSGSTFTNLRISGLPVLPLNPAPNTKIPLPLIGTVTLNEQIKSVTATSAALTVNALHIVITATNVPGIQAGTHIVLGHAASSLVGYFEGFVGGFAYGTRASVSNLVNSSPTALITLPCVGTNGQFRTNSQVGINLPGLLNSGTVTTSVKGTADSTTVDALTLARVASLNIASGLITAGAVKAQAHATKVGNNVVLSDAGSELLNLNVANLPNVGTGGAIAPNTRVPLAGLGTLWLRRVIKTADTIEVRMVELQVASQNTLGLPVGLNLRLGVANASVK